MNEALQTENCNRHGRLVTGTTRPGLIPNDARECVIAEAVETDSYECPLASWRTAATPANPASSGAATVNLYVAPTRMPA